MPAGQLRAIMETYTGAGKGPSQRTQPLHQNTKEGGFPGFKTDSAFNRSADDAAAAAAKKEAAADKRSDDAADAVQRKARDATEAGLQLAEQHSDGATTTLVQAQASVANLIKDKLDE